MWYQTTLFNINLQIKMFAHDTIMITLYGVFNVKRKILTLPFWDQIITKKQKQKPTKFAKNII